MMIQQLHDYLDLFDGTQAWCGCRFSERDHLTLNETQAAECLPLIKAVKETNTKFQLNPIVRRERRMTTFGKWIVFHNYFAKALHGFPSISAIQAVYGIEDTPGNERCKRKPSDFAFNERVLRALATATLQKWLVMDT